MRWFLLFKCQQGFVIREKSDDGFFHLWLYKPADIASCARCEINLKVSWQRKHRRVDLKPYIHLACWHSASLTRTLLCHEGATVTLRFYLLHNP